jgi:hypothetical protein
MSMKYSTRMSVGNLSYLAGGTGDPALHFATLLYHMISLLRTITIILLSLRASYYSVVLVGLYKNRARVEQP